MKKIFVLLLAACSFYFSISAQQPIISLTYNGIYIVESGSVQGGADFKKFLRTCVFIRTAAYTCRR